MIEIRKNAVKNRLYLKLSGFLKEEEVISAGHRLIETAKLLRPGFDIINDISDFKPATTSVASFIENIQEDMKKLPVGRIVRVIGKNALGKMQLTRTSLKAGYNAYNVATMQEAEELLDAEKNPA